MRALVPVLAGAAVLAAWPPAAALRLRLDRARSGLPVAGLVLGLVLVLVALVRGGPSAVLLLLVVGTLVLALGHQVRRGRAAAEARRRGDAVLAACDGLAADLAAGLPPVQALEAVAREWTELRVVADAARVGADVPVALRQLGQRPGAEQLRVVAAAWVVAHRSGAGLAGAIAGAARTIREERATARVVATELAAARATARLLAVLPLGVLLVGRGSGADPFGFLVGTTPGRLCLAAGAVLSWIGLLWMQRIADTVLQP